MKQLLFLLLAFTLFSCNRQSDLEKSLTNGKWTFFMEESRSASYYIRFYEDGNYECYGIFSNIELIKDNGNKPSQKWKYLPEDKKLIFFGKEFKVTSIEKDSVIHMVKDGTKFSLYNYPNADGSIPFEPSTPSKGAWHCEGG